SVTRLQEMGRWLEVNGELVYDGKPFQFFSEGENIRYIQSRDENYLYLASFEWPQDYLHVKYVVPEENSAIHLLGYENALEWESGDRGVKVKMPEELQDPLKRPSDHIWVFKMKANPAEIVENPLITIHGQSADKHVFQNSTLIDMKTETANANIFYTTDGSVPDRNSKRYEEPFTMNNTALIRAIAIREGKVDSDIADFHLIRIDELDKYEQGVSYRYYERDNMKFLPDFSEMKPLRSGKLKNFTLEGLDHRADQFALIFESELFISEPGEYMIYTTSDDGSKLYVNNELIADNDGMHAATEVGGKVNLSKGFHSIKLEFFEAIGGEDLFVSIKEVGGEKKIIPDYLLFTKKYSILWKG
ncbi:MAG: FN3 associated domain-containing protein, partial [Bacteroidales bacterium]